MRILAVLTVRNEAAFLLEWLAHHRVVGFSDVLVFSNDCADGTDALLDRLMARGLLTHVRNAATDDGGVQWSALKQADKHPLTRAADWILPFDIDEFVNIHAGDGRLADLFAALPEATAITLTWRLFGNGGIVRYADAPVTEQFTRAAPVPCYWPWRAAMFKTLFRNDGTYRKLGVHRPRNPDPARVDDAAWFDGSGRRLPELYHRQKLFSPYWQANNGLVQLNHYALGAMESFVLKADRGRAVHAQDQLGIGYWMDRNFDASEDLTIARYRDETRAEIAALMADEETASLHQAGVAWRHRRFRELMADEPMRALFGQLRMAPPTRPLDRDAAGELMRWAQAAMRRQG
ncbi:MAG: glycosyltransferase family 2 protein [Pseudomonadota bacterium]